ncbi:MAG: TIGR03905 family TSCPD domain-containing protein [Clostridiales bacterium]|nr:TIGR03905 family TSCPD domain-containing protein [Clostridiales bacterium]
MRYTYIPKNVCARKIEFDINNNIITNVSFAGGCDGNLKAISKLVEGMNAEDIISKLSGNTCGFKNTSCADQLANAIKEAMQKIKN